MSEHNQNNDDNQNSDTTREIAIIGTGPQSDPDGMSFGMGYTHAEAWRRLPSCEIVGAADLVREHAEHFADVYGLPDSGVFEDYQRMLAATDPDIVSVTVPPKAHAPLVIGTAEHPNAPDAIHCEKPMALTWGGAQEMARTCEREDVQLTFNHQRRYASPVRQAREWIQSGAIGDLRRVEYTWGNFYDNGTHAIDLCHYLTGDNPVAWVLGQLDYRDEDVRFGTHNENQMLAQWRYENGVYGLASTGRGDGFAPADWVVHGSEGEVRVTIEGDYQAELHRDVGPTTIEKWEREPSLHKRAIADVIAGATGTFRPPTRARNALNATQVIFGGYESVRRRGRVEMPLDIEDNPLEALVAEGAIGPEAGMETAVKAEVADDD